MLPVLLQGSASVAIKMEQTVKAYESLQVTTAPGLAPLLGCPFRNLSAALPQAKMADSGVSSNPDEFQKVARAAADMEEKVTAWREYQQVEQELRGAKQMLSDSGGGICPWHCILWHCSQQAPSCQGAPALHWELRGLVLLYLARQADWLGCTEHAAILPCCIGLPSAIKAPRPITALAAGKMSQTMFCLA